MDSYCLSVALCDFYMKLRMQLHMEIDFMFLLFLLISSSSSTNILEASSVAKPHPLGNGVLPAASKSTVSYAPIEAKDGEVLSRAELPARFQYKAPKEDEIEDICSGGADLVW